MHTLAIHARHPRSASRRRRWFTAWVFFVAGVSGWFATHFAERAVDPFVAGPNLASAPAHGDAAQLSDEPSAAARESVLASASSHETATIDDAEVADEREPRKEREYLLALRELDARDPHAFDRRVADILAEAGTNAETLAALRAVYERRPAEAPAIVAHAVATFCESAERDAQALPDSVISWLESRARGEAVARATLAAVVWGDAPHCGPRLRQRALRAWILAAPDSELGEFARRLAFESDPVVELAGREALEERRRPTSCSTPIEEFQ
ncbi:MAG: hypothetical protein K8S98_11350 [Planctomycetes bacterium]|nr:hypothetical protein [Planctomycetota bacterium]